MDILTLEEKTYRAWAALETELYDGWVLRCANGYTGRANSVNPIYPSTLDVVEKINYCERWYQQRAVRLRFRLNEAAQPPELDTVLESAGYARHDDSLVMSIDLSSVKLSYGDVQIEADASEVWLANFCHLHPTHAPHLNTMRQLLAKIEPQKYFATLLVDDEPVAMGVGVRDERHVGLFDIITRTDRRGQGFGKRLVGSLLAQAKADGAEIGYLQVAAQNAPALRLYEGFGFRLAYRYWYRSR
jgi:N-acetylglutamate synthase